MIEPGWLTLIPPILTICLAIYSKRIYISLFVGIFLGSLLIAGGNIFAAAGLTVTRFSDVLVSGWNSKFIVLILFMGCVVAVMQLSGGTDKWCELLTKKGINTKRKLNLVTYFASLAIFVDVTIQELGFGAAIRPMYDKLKVPREKLAYILDVCAGPKVFLVPFTVNAAYIMGLIANEGYENSFSMFIKAIPFNLYCWFALIVALLIISSNKDFGPMKKAEERAATGKILDEGSTPMVDETLISIKPVGEKRLAGFLIPIFTVIIVTVAGFFITGNGDVTKCDGATAMLWGFSAGTFVGFIYLYKVGIFKKIKDMEFYWIEGMKGTLCIAVLMMLAIGFGATCREAGLGEYVANLLSAHMPAVFVPVLMLCAAYVISFATGTSWGTMATIFPIGVPTAVALGIPLPLMIGTMAGGAIFGDHCSVVSDSTVMASMGAASDHVDHVRTQLPYAVIAAVLTAIGCLIFSIILI